jgi:hypothetical protein
MSTPVSCVSRAEALAIMEGLFFQNEEAPDQIPYSEDELKVAAREGRFLYFVQRSSLMDEFERGRNIRINARVPPEYRSLRIVEAKSPSEWVLARLSAVMDGTALSARHLAHLCIRWNEHSLLRPFYRSELKSTTILKEGGSPAIVTLGFRSAQLHCRPLQNVFHLVGTARRAFPPPK